MGRGEHHTAADSGARVERDAGALFVFSHSGGKDRQALLIKVQQWVPAHQVVVIHATLGESEWPG